MFAVVFTTQSIALVVLAGVAAALAAKLLTQVDAKRLTLMNEADKVANMLVSDLSAPHLAEIVRKIGNGDFAGAYNSLKVLAALAINNPEQFKGLFDTMFHAQLQKKLADPVAFATLLEKVREKAVILKSAAGLQNQQLLALDNFITTLDTAKAATPKASG